MTRKHVAVRSIDRPWSRTDTALDRTPKVPSGIDARRRLPLDRLLGLFGGFGLPLSPAQFSGAVFEPADLKVGTQTVLSYRLAIDGIAVGPPVAVARLVPVIRVLFRAYTKDATTNEPFVVWATRQGEPFFTELFDDYARVTVDDLPELLAQAS